jgi:serine/threonine protein kinase
MIGKTLAHYEITSQLGKGGMGEVYQAKDLKLGRDVAIKVLSQEFAKDADRVARFQREAKLLASLNHPNIAAIHGLEESDGTHFLVLELIEGDTLADRIKAGPIPAEEALKLALQITEALEVTFADITPKCKISPPIWHSTPIPVHRS